MIKNIVKSLTNRSGTFFIIGYLALLNHSTSGSELEGYICENSLSKNGNISAFSLKQNIFKDKGQDVSTYFIEHNQSSRFYSNGVWAWNSLNNSSGHINFKKLSNFLNIDKPSIYIRYNHKVLDHLDVSPIIKIGGHSSFPKARIELINDNLYVHRNITLPKSLRAIFSSNYYIEHSEKFQIPTTIRYSLKSAFIEESLLCQRELGLKFINSLKLKPNDETFNPENWPKSLTPLLQSIQALIVEKFLTKKLTYEQFSKLKTFTSKMDLNRILKNFKKGLKYIDQSRLKNIVQQYNSQYKVKKSTLSFVNKVSEKEKILIKIPIDSSALANDKGSFIIIDFLDIRRLENVTISKDQNNLISFYFDSNKFPKKIKIGPIDIKSMYLKNTRSKLSQCTDRIRTHLSEYERKSFVFKRAENEFIDLDILHYERNNRQYPLNEFVITNNCRGTGNFEFEWPGLIKSNFHIPVKIINSFFDMKDFYVEDRMSKSNYDNSLISDFGFSIKDLAATVWSKYKEKEYQWKSLGDFNKASRGCNISKIEDDFKLKNTNYQKANFKYDLGRIEYDQFPTETRKKAGYNGIKTPISYVKTPCNDEDNKQSPPKHFFPPKPYFTMNSTKYWHKKTCSIVPINFFYYKDYLNYKVHLSKFEVDGVYVGRNRESSPLETTEYDQALLKNDHFRVPYDFSKLYSFKNVSISKDILTDTLSIKLNSKELNLIIANISITDLETERNQGSFKSDLRPWVTDNVQGIRKLVGITPFDLGNIYNMNPTSKNETFSLFYNANGEILNHHNTDIGIEQWILRSTKNGLILDLISHERITPIARIIIDYKL